MHIDLDEEVFGQLTGVSWLSRCGQNEPLTLPFSIERVACLQDAIESALSQSWIDTGTVAQGELTKYLSANYPDAYEGQWNRLAARAEEQIGKHVEPAVRRALTELGAGAIELKRQVMLDLCRIVMHASYRNRIRHVPGFFDKLWAIYRCGHLPCGWSGVLESWPNGQLVIY